MTACEIPLATLHPMALEALALWLDGQLTDKAFLFYATIVQSDNFVWVACLLGT